MQIEFINALDRKLREIFKPEQEVPASAEAPSKSKIRLDTSWYNQDKNTAYP